MIGKAKEGAISASRKYNCTRKEGLIIFAGLMRLQSLEIKGFKSFADHTVINFDADVIGIVGPNGSGKSNVVDAIRWVLGEQSSKELRLDQMSSVIFNGTKKRKPGTVAQVTLTFSNTKNLLPTEYQTVSVSRLLYRSGESEYRLNGVTCRLKDITNLFMDTGIGSNSYAIIALHMVDEILNDKDNARRRMFEQAAGISKYKARKKETLSKLKSTSDDLERVEDLLFEINNNLKTLEQQARRTKRFYEIKNQYKELSLKLAALKTASLKATYADLQRQLQAEEDNWRQLEVEQTKLEAQLESLRKANLDQEKSLSARQREVNELAGRIRDKEAERKVVEQKIEFARQNRQKATEQIARAEERLSQLKREIEDYQQLLNEEKQEETRLESALEAAETHLAKIRQEHGQLKAGLDEIVKAQQTAERELFELEKNKAIRQNQISSLQNDLQRLREEMSHRKTERATLEQQLAALQKQKDEQQAVLAAAQERENRRLEDIQRLEAEIERLNQKVQAIQREIDARKNEYTLTRSMVENLEGFPESIRFLSSAKNWTRDAQLLSDIIYVEADYRVAIENYLEPFLNYYVVQNVEQAYQAIHLLHSAQKGKANFFILDAFANYTPPAVLLPAETKRAVDLIQCDPAYRNLIHFLLHNVVVCDNDDLVRHIQDDNLVVLARSGRYIQRKHALSGGSIGLFEGKKIGRKKNLEVLEKSIKRSQQELDEHASRLHELRTRLTQLKATDSPKAIRQAQEALHQTMHTLASLQARLDNFEALHQEATARATEIQSRIDKLQKEIAEIDQQLESKSKAVEQARQRITSTDGSFREVAEALSQASADYNEKHIAFIRQQNKVSSLQRELGFREKSLEELQGTLQNARRLLDESAAEEESLQEQLQSLQEALVKDYELRREKESALSEAEQAFFKAKGGVHELEDKLRQIGKKANDVQLLINRLKDKLTETRFQLSSLAERLRIEFNLIINDAENLSISEEEKATIDETELQLKVERLKNRIDNYGEINPMAVEAYDEMKARYDTISAQREDILQAKEDLLETIQEIEDTATKQFLDAFGKIRLYFIDVFRNLFTHEDAADLILTDPDNPLESDIEIVAKPKGKRPQTISQLSGGEKTLTATALLFALYLLKPAPFCIFDEVDAPLDDANIEKFNRIIKEFSKGSQFIIVTHNKQTMAAVDTIYGVFMQEQGVSAVTQVDFRDLAHSPHLEEIVG
ncbi:MAG: chromosome partition protein Smc [Saprospiraceae bacterium]|nr:MAG: chromosome partition protein Smc [Saprospiraceae bacterium]